MIVSFVFHDIHSDFCPKLSIRPSMSRDTRLPPLLRLKTTSTLHYSFGIPVHTLLHSPLYCWLLGYRAAVWPTWRHLGPLKVNLALSNVLLWLAIDLAVIYLLFWFVCVGRCANVPERVKAWFNGMYVFTSTRQADLSYRSRQRSSGNCCFFIKLLNFEIIATSHWCPLFFVWLLYWLCGLFYPSFREK